MSHLNEIDDNINELIMSKSFDRLTDAEKARALEYAGSEEEYNNLRQTLLAITSSFNEEGAEEFAGDEMKNDLMSQFEKKYGTSGNRTKVVPLYRKPYFQLAVAASLALIFFLSFPVLRQADENKGNSVQLAKTEKTTEPKTGTNGETTTAVAGETNVTLNKPDVGTSETTADEQQARDYRTATLNRKDEKKEDGTLSTATLREKSGTETRAKKLEADNKVDQLNDFKKEERNGIYSWTSKEKQQDVLAKVSLEEKANADKNDYAPVPPQKTNIDDEVISANQKSDRAKNEEVEKGKKLSEKSKEKTEYTNYSGDHTHDLMNNAAGIAAVNANNTKSTIGAVSSFVEENKTEMMDLLFTVY